MHTIATATVKPLILPLVEPFQVATRTAFEARNVLIELHADSELVGLGSAAPVEYVTGETVETVVYALETAGPSVIGMPTDRLAPLLMRAHDLLPNQPAARAALEMALFDLWARQWRIPLQQHFGGALCEIETDVTIPIVAACDAADKAKSAWDAGFRHLKVKVGDPNGTKADYERLRTIGQAAPDASLRIDANQAFEPDAAVQFIRRACEIAQSIVLVEQPVPKDDFAGLKYVRHHNAGGPPIFADESAQSVESAAELIRIGAVDGINVKFMKSGIAGALAIGSMCRSNGIQLMIGCMLESRLSLTAACALAAGTGWFDFVDIDAHKLLQPSPLFSGGFTDRGAILSSETSVPGWGVNFEAEQRNISEP